MGESIASPVGTAPIAVMPPAPGTSSGGGSAVAGASGGGGATPPATDLASAVAQLQAALDQLSGAIAALRGAAGVQGGGPGATPTQIGSGCGCGSTTAPPAAMPPEAAPSTSPGDDKVLQSKSDSKDAGGGVREKIVAAARAELKRGVKEDAGEDKDKAGRIREYRTAVTGPGEDPDNAEAWCADFASWVWKQAGAPFGKNGQGEDYTVAMVEYAKKQGTWKPRGDYTPKPGDMVLIDWQGGNDVDHVAIVEKVENGKVYTIAGNESDRVKSASYALDDKRMMGFIPPSGG
jgi:hypothetical protein